MNSMRKPALSLLGVLLASVAIAGFNVALVSQLHPSSVTAPSTPATPDISLWPMTEGLGLVFTNAIAGKPNALITPNGGAWISSPIPHYHFKGSGSQYNGANATSADVTNSAGNTLFDHSKPWTMTCWESNAFTAPGQQKGVSQFNNDTLNPLIATGWDWQQEEGNGGREEFNINDASGNDLEGSTGASGDGFADGRWHMITCVFYNSNHIALYVDTTPMLTVTNGSPPVGSIFSTNDIYFGASTSAEVEFACFDGSMTNVGFWSIALTAQQVTNYFKNNRL